MYYLMILTPIVLVALATAGLIYVCYIGLVHFYYKWLAKFYCNITLKNNDEVYKWVVDFIQYKKFIKNNESTLRAKVKVEQEEWWK